MLFAVDAEGNKIHIDYSLSGKEYFCPICGQPLVCKLGKKRQHHFAHVKHSDCSDSWHYDMSEWHQMWQSFFPAECQEVVFSMNDARHRADIVINNIIIEFQHSPISAEEFCERNRFYHSLQKKIIWVFDINDKLSDVCSSHTSSIEPSLLYGLNTRSSIFSSGEVWSSADIIFLCTDYPTEYKDSDDQVFDLRQVSWFWCSPRRSSEVIYGVDQWIDNVEFIDIVLGKEKLDAKPKHGTIPFLWRRNKVSKWAIFENDSGFRVKISSDPIECYKTYGQLYGNFSAPNRFVFNPESKKVVGMAQWELLSFK